MKKNTFLSIFLMVLSVDFPLGNATQGTNEENKLLVAHTNNNATPQDNGNVAQDTNVDQNNGNVQDNPVQTPQCPEALNIRCYQIPQVSVEKDSNGQFQGNFTPLSASQKAMAYFQNESLEDWIDLKNTPSKDSKKCPASQAIADSICQQKLRTQNTYAESVEELDALGNVIASLTPAPKPESVEKAEQSALAMELSQFHPSSSDEQLNHHCTDRYQVSCYGQRSSSLDPNDLSKTIYGDNKTVNLGVYPAYNEQTGLCETPETIATTMCRANGMYSQSVTTIDTKGLPVGKPLDFSKDEVLVQEEKKQETHEDEGCGTYNVDCHFTIDTKSTVNVLNPEPYRRLSRRRRKHKRAWKAWHRNPYSVHESIEPVEHTQSIQFQAQGKDPHGGESCPLGADLRAQALKACQKNFANIKDVDNIGKATGPLPTNPTSTSSNAKDLSTSPVQQTDSSPESIQESLNKEIESTPNQAVDTPTQETNSAEILNENPENNLWQVGQSTNNNASYNDENTNENSTTPSWSIDQNNTTSTGTNTTPTNTTNTTSTGTITTPTNTTNTTSTGTITTPTNTTNTTSTGTITTPTNTTNTTSTGTITTPTNTTNTTSTGTITTPTNTTNTTSTGTITTPTNTTKTTSTGATTNNAPASWSIV
jgi:hypothetical protein